MLSAIRTGLRFARHLGWHDGDGRHRQYGPRHMRTRIETLPARALQECIERTRYSAFRKWPVCKGKLRSIRRGRSPLRNAASERRRGDHPPTPVCPQPPHPVCPGADRQLPPTHRLSRHHRASLGEDIGPSPPRPRWAIANAGDPFGNPRLSRTLALSAPHPPHTHTLRPRSDPLVLPNQPCREMLIAGRS